MTVVPDDNLMTLICDVCGDTTTGTACVLPDAEVVWTLVSDHGWSGSPFATGPHRCPRCSALPAGPAPRGGERTPTGVGGADEPPVVGVGGEATTGPEDALRVALRQAVDVHGTVVVNLDGVHVIDSAGLGLLVRAHREVRERDGRLCLAAPSRFIRTVLHTMKLDGVFPIFESLDEAVAQLRQAALPMADAEVAASLVERRPAGHVTV
ncbi:STAS domain-containing protein [Micromonospora craniellae]|uniref:Anti-sigma factor antagonist n=1 Tax=Micromonospora craniellae TaxID=2294034 RepID=A0A372G0A8_9ACTN|nr:STAS domain-containing protein [Micromonospora craniellae]QOC91722.1 STAS domain-containing protein [Micromonospora craniellae]RFS46501.1 anti-sigma factor antagonist [Micromonospora craniellae]